MLCVYARYFIGWIRKFICIFFELSSNGKRDIQNYGDTDMHEHCVTESILLTVISIDAFR